MNSILALAALALSCALAWTQGFAQDGAGGNIGADIVAKAPPDGYTPEKLGEFIKAELAKWAPIIKASGARMD
jgi:tripartite-type tricarboxylate transporter receptor subunit TctC